VVDKVEEEVRVEELEEEEEGREEIGTEVVI
jgi:hypothetical protein